MIKTFDDLFFGTRKWFFTSENYFFVPPKKLSNVLITDIETINLVEVVAISICLWKGEFSINSENKTKTGLYISRAINHCVKVKFKWCVIEVFTETRSLDSEVCAFPSHPPSLRSTEKRNGVPHTFSKSFCIDCGHRSKIPLCPYNSPVNSKMISF